MKRSTELLKDLLNLKNEIKALQEQGQIEQAHARLEEYKNLQKQAQDQDDLEQDELQNFMGVPLNNIKTDEPKSMVEVKNNMSKLFKNAVMPTEKMVDAVQDKAHNEVQLGKLMKGVMTGDWSNASKEREYLNVIEATGDGKVLIPQHLSASIMDLARAKSSMLGKVPTVTLTNGNLTIAKVSKDPVAAFIAEGEAIPFSDVAFAPVKMQSKVLAMLVPVSEILLKEGQNVEEAIRMAMAGSIAEAMDKALLYGVGDGTAEAKEPKGILTYTNINKDTFTDAITYTDIVKGVKPIAKANLKASDAVMPTDEHLDLLSSTNAQGDFLNPPRALEGVELDGSNNVAAGEVVVIDNNAVVVGVSPYLMFEKGFVADQFQKLQKTFRLYVGVDVALVNEKGVTHLTQKQA